MNDEYSYTREFRGWKMVEGRRWIHASGIHGTASCSITSHGWHGWGGREPRTRIDDHFLRAESEYFCVLLVEESFILVIREDDLVTGNLRYRSMSLKFLLIFNFRCRIRDKLLRIFMERRLRLFLSGTISRKLLNDREECWRKRGGEESL